MKSRPVPGEKFDAIGFPSALNRAADLNRPPLDGWAPHEGEGEGERGKTVAIKGKYGISICFPLKNRLPGRHGAEAAGGEEKTRKENPAGSGDSCYNQCVLKPLL